MAGGGRRAALGLKLRLMGNALDQIFVTIKHAVVGWFPGAVQPWVSSLLSIGPIIGVFALLFGIVTVIERKALG